MNQNRTKHILYIEDEPDQAEMVKMFLESNLPEVLVETRSSAAGAEEALNARCFDLVVLDMCLPGGEMGSDIARKILERDPKQPIHLMSAYRGSSCQALAAGVGLPLEPKMAEISPEQFLECVRCKLNWRPCETIGMRPLRPIEIISPHVREARAAA